MVRAGRSIPDYDAMFDPIRRAREEKSGRQSGDPAKAAQVLLRLVEEDEPPVHLLLGDDAVSLVRQKLDSLKEEIGRWEEVSRSTDFVQ